MSKDLTIKPDPRFNSDQITPIDKQFNDLMVKFNACVKNCDPFRQDMTKMAVCVNTCNNIWNSYGINK